MALIEFVGRLLLAVIFIAGGVGKAMNPEPSIAYMLTGGIPEILFWPSVVFEILAGVLLIIGFQTRLVAALLGVFCVVTAVLYHSNFEDPIQQALFFKNLAMAGGMLVVARWGPDSWSVDGGRR